MLIRGTPGSARGRTRATRLIISHQLAMVFAWSA